MARRGVAWPGLARASFVFAPLVVVVTASAARLCAISESGKTHLYPLQARHYTTTYIQPNANSEKFQRISNTLNING